MFSLKEIQKLIKQKDHEIKQSWNQTFYHNTRF